MKFSHVCSVVLVLSCAGVGCNRLHRHKLTPLPQAQAPTVPAQNTQPVTPPPAAPAPAPVETAPSTTPAPAPETQPAPKPKRKKIHSNKGHRKQNKKVVTDNAAAKPAAGGLAQTASNGASTATPAASPIGQLSADDSSGNPALRQQTIDLISSTEKRLKTVNSKLAASRQETMVQVQSFLTQAKQALEINDLQGANTLATKAKILVDELLK